MSMKTGFKCLAWTEPSSISHVEIIYMSYYPLGEALKVPEMKEPTSQNFTPSKPSITGKWWIWWVVGWSITGWPVFVLSLTGVEQVVEDIWDLEEGTHGGECPWENKPQNWLPIWLSEINTISFMPTLFRIATESITQTGVRRAQALPPIPPFRQAFDQDWTGPVTGGYDGQFEGNKSSTRFPLFTATIPAGILGECGRYGHQKTATTVSSHSSSELNEALSDSACLLTGRAQWKTDPRTAVPTSYSMKSSYVHFDIIIDASRFNIGGKYKWASDEMKQDDRENEIFLSQRFDYGSWALDMTIMQNIYYAIRHGSLSPGWYRESRAIRHLLSWPVYPCTVLHGEVATWSLNWFPLRILHPPGNRPILRNTTIIWASRISTPNWDGTVWMSICSIHLTASQIFLHMAGFEISQGEWWAQSIRRIQLFSQSMTHVIYLDYSLDEDLKLKGYLSVESVRREYESESDEGSHSKNYPKAGLSAAFLF